MNQMRRVPLPPEFNPCKNGLRALAALSHRGERHRAAVGWKKVAAQPSCRLLWQHLRAQGVPAQGLQVQASATHAARRSSDANGGSAHPVNPPAGLARSGGRRLQVCRQWPVGAAATTQAHAVKGHAVGAAAAAPPVCARGPIVRRRAPNAALVHRRASAAHSGGQRCRVLPLGACGGRDRFGRPAAALRRCAAATSATSATSPTASAPARRRPAATSAAATTASFNEGRTAAATAARAGAAPSRGTREWCALQAGRAAWHLLEARAGPRPR